MSNKPIFSLYIIGNRIRNVVCDVAAKWVSAAAASGRECHREHSLWMALCALQCLLYTVYTIQCILYTLLHSCHCKGQHRASALVHWVVCLESTLQQSITAISHNGPDTHSPSPGYTSFCGQHCSQMVSIWLCFLVLLLYYIYRRARSGLTLGVAGFLAITFFTDWKAVLINVPVLNNKFKKE